MHLAVLMMVSQFFISAIPLDWQMNQQDVVVSGTVLDAATGYAVPGARVEASSPAFDARTTSDPNGKFVFLTLFPGTYYLSVSSRGDDRVVYGTGFGVPPELFAGYEYNATIVLSD